MRAFLFGAVAASLAVSSPVLGAEKGTPTPPPPPGVVAPAYKAAVEAQTSKGVPGAVLPPFISELKPRRVHALGTLTVAGGHFGKDSPARPLRMRMGGHGFGVALDVTRWTESAVDVVIPKSAPPGSYYIGVADAHGQWVSAIDQTFEVLPETRDVAVTLDVTFRCVFDVLAPPPAIPINLSSPDRRTAAGRTTLAAAGQSPAPNGGRVYHFTGLARLRPGNYSAVADPAARFVVDVWDNPPTYWVSPACADRRRVTESGAVLPASVKQSRSVVLDDPRVRVTDDTASLSLDATVLIDLGSVELPAPVCPPGGCT